MSWRTVLFGYGRIAAGYAKDRRMSAVFRYPTHVSVLADHPDFELVAVVEPDATARAVAEAQGMPRVVANVTELSADLRPDVAVLAIPPTGRLAAIEAFSELRAVMVEKPVGVGPEDAERFAAACRDRGLITQVNLLRRGDAVLRRLAAGELSELTGRPQAVFGVYGRGLYNTASHMVDLLRMLVGEPDWVQAAGTPRPVPDAAHAGDVAIPFNIGFADGATAMFAPLDYRCYREAGLDIWGTAGRLAIMQEGLGLLHFPRVENRGLDDEWEIACDRPRAFDSEIGTAQYLLYDNLADALCSGAPLWSGLDSALRTEAVLHAAVQSGRSDGIRITIN